LFGSDKYDAGTDMTEQAGYPQGGEAGFVYPVPPADGRHQQNAGIYLLADGHVKWLRADNVSPGVNAYNGPTSPQMSGYYAAGTEGSIPGGTLAATYSIY
jgi:prepilin-type processing-associated H-X9-DG protein